MSESKDTNPKDAVGVAKTPFSTMSMAVLGELGLVMMEGARKYGRHNYRAVGVRASVYVDAAFRHLARFWEGEDLDPDSGMPHLVHAMACCLVLRDSQIQGNETDDRPPRSPDGWITGLNKHAADLIERYPNPVPAFTQMETRPRQWNSLEEIPHDEVWHVVSPKGCNWRYRMPGHRNDRGDRVISTEADAGQWMWNSASGDPYENTGPFTEVIESKDSVAELTHKLYELGLLPRKDMTTDELIEQLGTLLQTAGLLK